MPLTKIADGIRTGLAGRSFDGSLKFDCGADGVIILAAGDVSTVDRDTDCALHLSTENLQKLLAGKLNPMTAVMLGKIRITGDMPTALKLARLLG